MEPLGVGVELELTPLLQVFQPLLFMQLICALMLKHENINEKPKAIFCTVMLYP
jgi:hypothetical protein